MSLTERSRPPAESVPPAPASARYPFPSYPSGWYAVAYSEELPPGGVLGLSYFGRELVAFRTASGEACVADAYCPHMGAHLARGGRMVGETLRCPFHGFLFDAKGACVGTPYRENVPARTRLATWPVLERDGALLVYHDDLGRAPEWKPPDISFDDAWGSPLKSRFAVATHPQETTENSVDSGHLGIVHGYGRLEVVEPLTVDGPHLRVKYAVDRSAASLLRPGRLLRAEFEIRVAGLGWSFVDVTVADLGLRSRQFVYSTPVDGSHVHIRAVLRLGPLPSAARVHPALALLPPSWARRLVARLANRTFLSDLSQDFEIWEHKVYVDPPVLAPGDGPIARYRRWARQFYVGGGTGAA